MFRYRSILLLSFVALCWGASALSQSVLGQSQPPVQMRLQQSPVQQGAVQQHPLQTQPLQVQPTQTQPTQTPPLGAQGFGTPSGQSIYQPPPQQIRQPPMGQPVVTHAQAPTGMNVGHPNPNMGQPNAWQPNMGQPVQIAANPAAQPPAVGTQPGLMHMGRAEPPSRIIPYYLNAAEQRELDEFLVRWERYSTNIKRYEVDFYLFDYDPTIPGAQPNVPHKISFGYFKYNSSPMRYLSVIEGEWRDNKRVARDGDKNPHIHAEKILIEEGTVFKYDYNAKTVYRINVPPEMIGKGIADSPLPLIFGAKADELKRRFSMRLEQQQSGTIVLYARPLLIEDQQEFKEIEVMLEQNLRARGLKQYDINGKGYKVYDLRETKINPLGNILDFLEQWFKSDVPRGWKEVPLDMAAVQPVQPPVPTPAVPQVPMGNPLQIPHPQQPGVPLYRGQ